MDKKKKILKKNKVKAPNTKTVGEPKSEIFGLFLMVIGIIFFISIFSDKMGIIGRLVYKFLSVLLGSANYIFPLLLIFWGILYNITATKLYTKRYIICSLIIYFSILILLDASKELDLTLVDRINRSIEYMSIARSGGIIGAILGFFSYKLLGSLGTYIFVGIIILVNLYIMLRTNIDQIIMAYEDLSDYLEDRKKILAEKKIKRENDKSNKVEERELKKSQKEDKKLKILDNFKIKKDNLLEDNKTKENKDFIIKEYKTTNINNTQENNSNIQESSSEELTEKDKEEFKNIDQELPDETYIYPDISLLNINESNNTMSNQEIIKNGKIIEKTLDNFNMDCQITSINKGPVITCYELKPAPGIKLSRIVSLADNISMALGSSDIRIEAPIPGKTVVGIEVANKFKDSVGLREILESSEFVNSKSDVPLTLGKDVEGNIIVESISDMPHLLIAGATGSGKSVCINTIITNILYKSSPNDVRLMLIDPKVVELSVYNGIPHLLIPVVTNPKKAGYALNWAVDEMERRYKLFAEAQVRDIKGYNKKKIKEGKISEKIPKIVIIVDELADLMMVSSNEIEDYIARLAQMARACGMHLILATQRPSVDVITGTIKANIPSRIAFAVSSAVDSRTILDMSGAEKLLGRGDMLFYPSS